MILREGARKVLALTGCGLWLASSLMPLFGGAAKHQVLCRGRVYAGSFDDCFGDYIPLLEFFAPVAALALLYPFARLSFPAWSPEPAFRRGAWRLAPRDGAAIYHPGYPVLCLIGGAWSAWRLLLYPLDVVTLPFIVFWGLFLLWFGGGAYTMWQTAQEQPID